MEILRGIPVLMVNESLIIKHIIKLSITHALLKYLLIDKRKHKGTRYITEDLIKKLTKCDNLSLVRTLDLSTSMKNDKQFRVRFGQCLLHQMHILLHIINIDPCAFMFFSILKTWTSASICRFSTSVTTQSRKSRNLRN